MTFSEAFVKTAKHVLPSPFTIAVLLTVFTALLALLLTDGKSDIDSNRLVQVAMFWEKGMWELLGFAMQMMLMLVLGHVLALSAPVNRLINKSLGFCKDTASAAFFVCCLTMVVALVNWGLGLIFGAIFARKVGEYGLKNELNLHYPLIGAAGYSGLMVWHGGLSGSAPLKIAEENNFLSEAIKSEWPSGMIPISETIFSPMNLLASLLVIILVPSALYWLAKRTKAEAYTIPISGLEDLGSNKDEEELNGAERLDHSKFIAYGFGGLIFGIAVYKAIQVVSTGGGLSFVNPNFINLILFGACLLLHGNFARFLKGVDSAIAGSSGIMIQFPLYAGIMGIMKYSGLIDVFSDFFVQISSDFTFPLFTFLSAGIVNVFVPSGGGQWAVQGPIIVDAASHLGVALPKCVMALSYGDQLTNMMQPFWALPLLGITGLKAKDILPYTLFMMLVGALIYVFILMIF